MPRAYLDLPASEVRDISRAGFRGDVIEHIPTRIVLYVDNMRTGYYARCEDYSINDPMPFILRSDMPTPYRIEHQETMNRSLAASYGRSLARSYGYGHFVCDTGTVEISEIGVRLEVYIAADSVDNFNATVQALKNGELKPVGSEQTVLEKLKQELALANDETDVLARQAVEYMNRAHELERFVEGIKNRSLWQRLWNLPPTPVEMVKESFLLKG